MFQEVLSHLQQEFKSWHDKLSNLHPKCMFILENPGVVPSRFLDLKYDVTLCASFMFGTASRRQWRKKGNKSGSIRKETDNNLVYWLSIDQLQSAQTELAPQLSGKLTSARICAVQVMAEHFSGLTYVQLMRITIQYENLAVNEAFERWYATFGF